jgi:protoheme IX farnesyltransferase
MEDIAIDVRKDESIVLREKIRSYVQLTKPRIAFMLVLTAAAGFYLGSTNFDLLLFLRSILGITLLAFGTAALNQYIERKSDALMQRTASRPLPSGRLTGKEALLFGIVLCTLAELILFISVNTLTGILGLLVIVGYVFLYTPLKRLTTLSTVVGAFPGAMPPLMGWTSAADQISVQAWILFAIIFFWQFPHFLSIAWIYRDEYSKAGIKMLPVVDKNGKLTVRQVIIFTFLLIATSIIPFLLGMTGTLYLITAISFGAYFLYCSLEMARKKSINAARKVLIASVLYLPLIFALMVINH